MGKKWDFSGWATKTGLRCSDGRTILKGAFKHCDGQTVPLIWNHRHNDPSEVLGHALLEDRDGDIYAYCSFNDSANGRNAKELVEHGDIVSLSIYANQLTQSSKTPPCDVIHGTIREVSLVLAGANPGAFIDNVVLAHGEVMDDEAEIYHDEDDELYIYHADEEEDSEEETEDEGGETVKDILDTLSDKQKAAVGILIQQITSRQKGADTEEAVKHADESEEEDEEDDSNDDETNGDIIETLTPKQRKAVEALVGMAIADKKNSNKEEENVKHNAFDTYENEGLTLSHSDMEQIFKDGKRLGSLKAAVEENVENGVLAHTVTDRNGNEVTYGIADIDYLFPDAKTINNTPEFIQREQSWVKKVINGTHHTPFSRVKSMYANITIEEARAKGYTKGKKKAEEVIALLKRETTPQTIYKKQKLDRDDIIDITDFDVVAWIKGEMRLMLEEEIARAILIGDGRNGASDDKISEEHVRPVYNDEDLFTVKVPVEVPEGSGDAVKAKALLDAAITSRKLYKGSGNLTFFTTEDWLSKVLLLEDGIGHRFFKTEDEIATALRVKDIVTVEVMEGQQLPITVNNVTTSYDFIGVMVNLSDYNVGADKGGQTAFFDDFDIDYNQQKYLYETRMSGALIKPYSALSFYVKEVEGE